MTSELELMAARFTIARCKAYYFHQLGREMIMNGEDRQDANRHLRLSANEYMNALDFFPQDDELYSRTFLFRYCRDHPSVSLFERSTSSF